MPQHMFICRRSACVTRNILFLFSSFIFFLFLIQLLAPARVQADPKNTQGQGDQTVTLSLPSSYGRVVYSYNATSPNTVYVIGISHRDSRNRLNGSDTVKTQAEVYKIGEWLNRTRNLNLLLPEGFFGAPDTHNDPGQVRPGPALDDDALVKTLANTSHFINAEMLLMEQFHMLACQVENQRLYNDVLNLVFKLEETHDDPAAALSLKMQIDRLQEKRTAAILQNIPTVIETEFQEGMIKNKNALFTIGLNHIATIINYLKNNTVHSQPHLSAVSSKNGSCDGMNLKNKGFGVIVIIPRTLLQDREVMRMTNLYSLL